MNVERENERVRITSWTSSAPNCAFSEHGLGRTRLTWVSATQAIGNRGVPITLRERVSEDRTLSSLALWRSLADCPAVLAECRCVEVLIKVGGAVLDVKDSQFGGTALIWAAQHSRPECVQVRRSLAPRPSARLDASPRVAPRPAPFRGSTGRVGVCPHAQPGCPTIGRRQLPQGSSTHLLTSGSLPTHLRVLQAGCFRDRGPAVSHLAAAYALD
jgi:hypothetical protein